MPDKFREFDGLVDLIIRNTPRRTRRSLFSEEKAQRWLLDEGGPDIDQSIGIDDLDPAFPDYNVANLFNAYFRDGDPEDNTLDYWTFEQGDVTLDVNQCANAPGGICLVYAPTGAVTTSSKLISGAVPIGPALDIGVIVSVGTWTGGNVTIKPSLKWYDEEENHVATTTGVAKVVNNKVMRWLKVPRSKAAQAASFVSLVLEFESSGTGVVVIYGVAMYPLTPSLKDGKDSGPDKKTPTQTPTEAPASQALYLYDDFERTGGRFYESQGEYADEIEIPLPDGIQIGDTVVVVYGLSSTSGGVSNFWNWVSAGWVNMGSSANGDIAGHVMRSAAQIKKIDGTEGFSGTNDVIDIDVIVPVEVSHTLLDQFWSYAFIVKNVEDLGSPDDFIGWGGGTGWSTGSATVSAWADPKEGWTNWTEDTDPCFWVVWMLSDKPIVDDFTGYTRVFDISATGLGSGTAVYMRLAMVVDDSATHTSDDIAFDTDSYGIIGMVALKAGSAPSVLGIGSIPLGSLNDAPWQGDTPWLSAEDVFGSLAALDGMGKIEDGVLVYEASSGTENLGAFQSGSTWERNTLDGPEVIATSSDLTATDYSDPTTTYDLALPDGCDVDGRYLICMIESEPWQDLQAEMAAAGWSVLIGEADSPFYYKQIAGTEGYTGVDDVDEIAIDDVGGETPVVTSVVLLVDGIYDDGDGIVTVYDTSTDSADPPAISLPWWDGTYDNMLAITAIRTEETIYDGPEDYDLAASDDETGLEIRVDYAIIETAAEDPSTYTTDDDMSGTRDKTWTILIPGISYQDDEGGYVPATALPEGVHNVPHMMLFKMRFVSTGGAAYWEYIWQGSTYEQVDQGGGIKIVYVQSSDTWYLNLQGQGSYVISNMTLDDWYWVLVDMTTGVQQCKIWKDGDLIPATWLDAFALTNGSEIAYLGFTGQYVAGTRVEIEEMWAGIVGEIGTGGRVYIGVADGTTTEYQSPLQWDSGGPKVYVDGFLTPLAGWDSSDWTFTFDRAPSYGARIEVEV